MRALTFKNNAHPRCCLVWLPPTPLKHGSSSMRPTSPSLGAALIWCIAFSAACGDDLPPPQLIPITDCYRGFQFAECGLASGSAEMTPTIDASPRLACSVTADACAWFHGEVATSFVASDCPADNVCCHEGAPGNWGPYVDAPVMGSLLTRYLYSLGSKPWARGLYHVAPVTLGPVPVEVPLDCGDPALLPGPPGGECGKLLPFRLTVRDTIAFIVGVTNRPSWSPYIEIDPSTMTASICAYTYDHTPEVWCPWLESRPPLCATSGSVQLTRLPSSEADVAGLMLEFEATFPGGSVIRGTGRPPP